MEPESPWNDDPHLHPNSTSTSPLEYLSTVTDYFSIPLCVAAIVADLFLTVVILKYKRLKKRTNLYLVNFNISHILYIISTPLLYYMVSETFYEGQMDIHWYCVWIRVENFAMGLAFSFIAGYGMDSFLEKAKPSWFSRYKERYLYVFSFFYFGHFLVYLIAASICLKRGFNNNFNFHFLSGYFFLALISILYVTYEEQKLEKNLRLSTPHKAYSLTVSVIILLMWMPLIIFYNMVIIFANFENVERVLWYTLFLPEYLAYCCPMVIIYELWKSSKQFRNAFRKVLRMAVLDSDFDELNVHSDDQ
ncbi:uncharacterized protein LOC108908899 [Anoplophora glabripennis]|uniref:uncharacterized protein LOC108908899 n=1 Tax=Anoplophora glabripennis TaxID=217634 RepID=UPI000875772B|nr:uncharacterized protein LOC108908899 [Anoplophora glabripennis]